jgi:hypothetical protein
MEEWMATQEQRIIALEQEVARLGQLVAKLTAKAESTGRQTRLPMGWQPPADLVNAMRKAHPNVDIERETAVFIDYWLGTGGTKADWNATYRNWIRKEARTAPAAVAVLPSRSASRTSTIDTANRQRVDGALAKLAALR